MGWTPTLLTMTTVMYSATARNAPCAKFTMSSTPKISVRPIATRPYTPPIRIPVTTAWVTTTPLPARR